MESFIRIFFGKDVLFINTEMCCNSLGHLSCFIGFVLVRRGVAGIIFHMFVVQNSFGSKREKLRAFGSFYEEFCCRQMFTSQKLKF